MRGAQMTLRMVSSGEWYSFCTSARFGSPNPFKTLPGCATARARTSRTALCERSCAWAARQSAMKRSTSNMRRSLSGKIPQQPTRERLAVEAHAVHPDAFDAHRRGREARVTAGEVEDPLLGAAIDGRRIEEQQVGVVAGLERAAFLDAEDAGRMAGEAPR